MIHGESRGVRLLEGQRYAAGDHRQLSITINANFEPPVMTANSNASGSATARSVPLPPAPFEANQYSDRKCQTQSKDKFIHRSPLLHKHG